MSDVTGSSDMTYEEVNPQSVTEADVAVIIPSYNEAANIALPARKAGLGLAKHFPGLKAVVINCDNHSPDGTKEAFLGAEIEVPRIYMSTPPGVMGEGANMRNAFDKIAALGVKAAAVLGANLTSIRTRWIESLLAPIIEGGAEFVSPIYARHRYDSPISKGLVYPLGRALFGRRVLQPISVDTAFSGRLAAMYRQREWPNRNKGYYLNLHMLYLAIANQARICQAYMAHPRVTASRKSARDFGASFKRVAENLFDLILASEDYWLRVGRSRPTALAGVEAGPMNLPPQVEVDRNFLIKQFVRGSEKTRVMWADVFGAELAVRLEKQLEACAVGGSPVISIDLWQPAVYNAALAYKRAAPAARCKVVACLEPLFFAKALDTYLQGRDLDDRQFNALLEDEAGSFEAAKKDFIARWNE